MNLYFCTYPEQPRLHHFITSDLKSTPSLFLHTFIKSTCRIIQINHYQITTTDFFYSSYLSHTVAHFRLPALIITMLQTCSVLTRKTILVSLSTFWLKCHKCNQSQFYLRHGFSILMHASMSNSETTFQVRYCYP